MCPPADKSPHESPEASNDNLKKMVGGLSVLSVGLLISTIVLATNQGGDAPAESSTPAVGTEEVATVPDDTAPVPAPAEPVVTEPVVTEPVVTEPVVTEPSNNVVEEPSVTEPMGVEEEFAFLAKKWESSFYTSLDANVCAGAKLSFDNKLCVDLEVAPQAGANVTKGYVGNMDVGDLKPNTNPYFQSSMCPVNVHWHLGTEHYSYGQYDENGDGPHGSIARPDWADRARALAEGSVRDGFRCNHYDADDEKFTKPYEWKHCEGMEVGETYEVHWPHSAAGACGTTNQYQTPFYDGVFCNLPMEAFVTLGAQDIASAVGVHGQVFTIVNDDSYYYADMIRGMIVDGEMGKDIHIYTGSTTGTSRDNEMCSQYAPITWQVDRKCHMISASSFDKMCFDMKMQRDDMSGDLHAHGSRELVHDDLSANNQHYPEAVAAAEPAAEEAVAVEPSNRKMAETHAEHTTTEHTPSFLDLKFESNMYTDLDANTCAGAKLAFDNKLCADLEVAPQAGANVTKGYVGNMDVGDLKPNTNAYFQSKMCPVNVHWHLGTEHYSYGQYDENGDGPHGNIARPDWADRARALAEGSVRDGFRCNHYDATDEKFTKPYEWKHCEGMEVGETYEVHWPHSSVGACNTPNQYQTPFYDGVFCNLPMESFVTLSAQDIAANVGVHGQVFTIVNDEEYFYSDMIRGMVIDDEKDMGKDIHIYTGSTTGTSRDNEMCSQYAPITWQVDRKCHMISASSFDKMCSDMKAQRDDMSGDLHAHGSRELVHDDLAANNQHYPDGVRKNLRA